MSHPELVILAEWAAINGLYSILEAILDSIGIDRLRSNLNLFQRVQICTFIKQVRNSRTDTVTPRLLKSYDSLVSVDAIAFTFIAVITIDIPWLFSSVSLRKGQSNMVSEHRNGCFYAEN